MNCLSTKQNSKQKVICLKNDEKYIIVDPNTSGTIWATPPPHFEDLQLGPRGRRSAVRAHQQILAPERTHVRWSHGLGQEGQAEMKFVDRFFVGGYSML